MEKKKDYLKKYLKKYWKRPLSLVLVGVLCLTVSITAFAFGGDPGTENDGRYRGQNGETAAESTEQRRIGDSKLTFDARCLMKSRMVEIHCSNRKSDHPDKSYWLLPGGFAAGEIEKGFFGGYTVKVTISPDLYVARYNVETGVEHTLDPASQEAETLTYTYDEESRTWNLKEGKTPVVYTVVCKETETEETETEKSETEEPETEKDAGGFQETESSEAAENTDASETVETEEGSDASEAVDTEEGSDVSEAVDTEADTDVSEAVDPTESTETIKRMETEQTEEKTRFAGTETKVETDAAKDGNPAKDRAESSLQSGQDADPYGTPATGDHEPVMFYVFLMLAGAAGSIGLLIGRKKNS